MKVPICRSEFFYKLPCGNIPQLVYIYICMYIYICISEGRPHWRFARFSDVHSSDATVRMGWGRLTMFVFYECVYQGAETLRDI